MSVVEIAMSRSGSNAETGRSTIALNRLKTAVFAPIASANVAVTTSENPGDRRRLRSEWRMSIHRASSMVALDTRSVAENGVRRATPSRTRRSTAEATVDARLSTDYRLSTIDYRLQ